MGVNRSIAQGKMEGRWAYLCACDGGAPSPRNRCPCGRRGRMVKGRMLIRDQRRTERKWWMNRDPQDELN